MVDLNVVVIDYWMMRSFVGCFGVVVVARIIVGVLRAWEAARSNLAPCFVSSVTNFVVHHVLHKYCHITIYDE